MEKWKMIVLSAVVLIVIAIIVTKFTRPGSEYEMPRQGEYTVVEIGADLCIPCQLMQPVMEKLKEDIGDRVTIHTYFINNTVKDLFDVTVIPTVIIFDEDAVEVYRRVITEQEVPEVRDWIIDQLNSIGCEVE
ncbi:MAG TPA: thioredoxin family protein [Caldisericia bacterium]|nr:thioredoxin family protein [Caldisericia bacterium]HPF48563.1 thioredoxin family protein [Caldisericia bacterium]HPI83777.1 thioredoxin family protein [Caldisericia bacterium]HPQ93018.1 thioredoxin family protein [Caldisericia bacterium]HRV75149.1 thioredoxin family protein [Caldisericia bacterium]